MVQKRRKSKGLKPPTITNRDRNRLKRVEAACGLYDPRKSEDGGIEADQTGNLVLLGDPDRILQLSESVIIGIYPEGDFKEEDSRELGRRRRLPDEESIADEPGKRLRVVKPPIVFNPHTREIMIGGSPVTSKKPHPDDGYHGHVELPSGRICLRDEVPDDYKGMEAPAGLYKDMRMVSSTHPLSPYAYAKKVRDSNKQLLRELPEALEAIEKTPTKGAELEAPIAFVARDGLLDVRFLKGAFEDVMNATRCLVDVANSSFWTLRGLEDVMTAKQAGVVKDVGEHHIIVEYSDGSGEMLSSPREAIASYIRERVAVKTANLPVVPLVVEGEKFDAGTVLWGGTATMYESAEDFMVRTVTSDVNEGQALQLLRVWAVLVMSTEQDGRELYSMKYVEARKSSQVYFRPGVSRVRLKKHPSKMLVACAPGIKVDLFTLAHRARYWREYRATLEAQAPKAPANS